MGQFQVAGTINDGFVGQGLPIGNLAILNTGGQAYLVATGVDGVSTAQWAIGDGQAPGFQGSAPSPGASYILELGGGDYIVSQGNLDRFIDSGGKSGLQLVAGSGQVHSTAATLADGYIILADPSSGTNEIAIIDMANDQPVLLDTLAFTDAPTVLDSVEYGGNTLIFGASAASDDVTVWRMSPDGSLTQTASAADGIGINQPTALASIDVGGRKFLAVGASGSNSITVFEIDPAGGLVLRDHVLDSLPTRFGSIQQLELVEHNGRSILLAGGTDGGVTALSLMPDGRVINVDTVIDTTAISLENVNHMTSFVSDGVLEMFVGSSGAQSLTHLTMDLADLRVPIIGTGADNTLTGAGLDDLIFGGDGDDTLSGNAGRDIIYDGTGEDVMSGGSGSDLFVLEADGKTDTITDFEVGVDRLDLSSWSMLYSAIQIDQISTAAGVILSFRDEVLILESHNGQPINIDSWPSSWLFNIDRPARGSYEEPEMTTGGNAAEILTGGSGTNRIFGMGGNDVISGGPEADHLDGGDGFDIVTYALEDEAIIIDLASGDPASGGALGDMLYNFEGVIGSAFGDRLFGTNAANEFEGNHGADLIDGRGGADVIRGGAGADDLRGGDGDDRLWGESAFDTLSGDEGNDWIAGGTGSDQLSGGAGNDALYGNTGNDVLFGGDGGDVLSGGSGADTINGDDGDDYMIGHDGWDVLYGGSGNDEIRGSTGRDLLFGGSGNDELHGGTSVDDLDGGAGDDVLFGNQGADLLMGGAGNDLLHGGSAVDTLYGGSGNDVLYGNEGADILHGGEDADALYGGTGEDWLSGGSGSDILFGNQGADVLDGGAGDDILRGGTHADEFVYGFASGADVIQDFIAGLDMLTISSRNWSQAFSEDEVISEFGWVDGDDLVLDFGGGNSLRLENAASQGLDDIADSITIT